MASGKTEEEGLENPFKDATETTDVLVKVQDETLHLHSFLLAFYSPVLREAFESREQQLETGDVRSIEITIDSYSAEDVVIFFMFFYPEYKQKIVHGKYVHALELIMKTIWYYTDLQKHQDKTCLNYSNIKAPADSAIFAGVFFKISYSMR